MDIASRIPTEILEKIFLHAIDGPIHNIERNSFPWALERVCKSWRSAFVSYPDLWTYITIDLSESYFRGQDLNAVNQWLSLCLERSRNYPLNISLHLPIEEHDDYSPSFTLVWKTFLSCSHRWRTVYLENVHDSQVVTLNSCTGATPILESLTITSDTEYSDFTGFQIAPRLTHFGLEHPIALLAVGEWSIPWMQLTHLILIFDAIGDMDQLRVLVKQLRDIEVCFILQGDEPEFEYAVFVHNSGTPQCLQHLHTLVVCCVEIFSLITAPSLSDLVLRGSKSFYPRVNDGDSSEVLAEEILSSFIHRSSCTIEKLFLSDFSKHRFTPLVLLFPHMVELCLENSVECLEHLLSPNHFPALRLLNCIGNMGDPYHTVMVLQTILEWRAGSSARWSLVPLEKIIFNPANHDEDIPVTTDRDYFTNCVRRLSSCELDLTKEL